MNPRVDIAMYGWPLFAIMLFAFLPPRRAAIVSMLGGWLFLPVAYIALPGIMFDRNVATSLGALLGVLIFDFRKLLQIRPSWIDLPILGLCLCPIPSSIANDLGFQDGVHAAVGRLFELAIPYLMGRMYFHDPTGLKEVAVGLFIGGLIYMPLCLIEIRLSPIIHTYVYGYHQHDWSQSMRYGGWRPTVFMKHGLEVGMWMSVASLAGVWLWMSQAVKKIFSVPVAWLLPPLLGTTVLCKSVGALMLLGAGLAALALTRWPGTKWAIVVMALCPMFYVAARAPGVWSADQLTSAASVFGEDRVGSLQYRLTAEDKLSRHALRQPVFGWGGWGRNRPTSIEEETPDFATDGLWIITLGIYGFVGLLSLLATFLVPPVVLAWRLDSRLWSHPWCASAAILAMVLIMFMIDCLMNAMMNPFYLVAAGGLSRAVRAPIRRQASASTTAPVIEGHLEVG